MTPERARHGRRRDPASVILRALLCTAFAVLAVPASADERTVSITGALRVLDGDTLEVGPLVLRLHGIDAPELSQDCARPSGGAWPCGRAAAERLTTLLAADGLDCEALDRDAYGRIVARCAAGGVELGGAMVAEGLAWAFVQYSGDYVSVEARARAGGIGIWQAPSQTAWDWRADAWARAVAASPAGCPIKGNVNDGERIYHTPWSAYYGRVVMDVEAGERWFCDEAEAQAAGWRAARGR